MHTYTLSKGSEYFFHHCSQIQKFCCKSSLHTGKKDLHFLVTLKEGVVCGAVELHCVITTGVSIILSTGFASMLVGELKETPQSSCTLQPPKSAALWMLD